MRLKLLVYFAFFAVHKKVELKKTKGKELLLNTVYLCVKSSYWICIKTKSIKFNNAFQSKGETATLEIDDDSAQKEGVIASFDATRFGSAKFIIQADEVENSQRQLSELLVIHDGTNASATEYGVIQSSSYEIAEYDVRLLANIVELVATNLTPNLTTYRVVETLMLI